MIHFLMLVSRQGKVRLTKWFSQVSSLRPLTSHELITHPTIR